MLLECRRTESIGEQQGEGGKGRKWLQVKSVNNRKGETRQRKSRFVVAMMGGGLQSVSAVIHGEVLSVLADTLLLLSRKGQSISGVCERTCVHVYMCVRLLWRRLDWSVRPSWPVLTASKTRLEGFGVRVRGARGSVLTHLTSNARHEASVFPASASDPAPMPFFFFFVVFFSSALIYSVKP